VSGLLIFAALAFGEMSSKLCLKSAGKGERRLTLYEVFLPVLVTFDVNYS
jgi:hypothetical protein